ncbi:hypothetical protein EV130_104282 [Rhizobium azibense]|uniref:Uncharacterized protein n=1 Tax=Rhizobium azibense TaxID=1136135 RepID=A0A4R3QW42_9HYPH|nr:hypothetical protein EV130_104282 [Rhizobium azibense]
MNSASGLEPTSIPTSLPSRIEGPAGFSFAFPGVAAYAASKSGLVGLMQALAAEFGRAMSASMQIGGGIGCWNSRSFPKRLLRSIMMAFAVAWLAIAIFTPNVSELGDAVVIACYPPKA